MWGWKEGKMKTVTAWTGQKRAQVLLRLYCSYMRHDGGGGVTGVTAVVASFSVVSSSWQNVRAHKGGAGCEGDLSAGSFYGFQTERVFPLTLARSHWVGSVGRVLRPEDRQMDRQKDGAGCVWLAVNATPYLGTWWWGGETWGVGEVGGVRQAFRGVGGGV